MNICHYTVYHGQYCGGDESIDNNEIININSTHPHVLRANSTIHHSTFHSDPAVCYDVFAVNHGKSGAFCVACRMKWFHSFWDSIGWLNCNREKRASKNLLLKSNMRLFIIYDGL